MGGNYYPNGQQGGYNGGYNNGGYGNQNPYYGGQQAPYYGGGYNGNHDQRERDRIAREREALRNERRRLENDRERHQEQHHQNQLSDNCPPGFHHSEVRCSQDDRRRGCKDLKAPSGRGCVSGRNN